MDDVVIALKALFDRYGEDAVLEALAEVFEAREQNREHTAETIAEIETSFKRGGPDLFERAVSHLEGLVKKTSGQSKN